MCDENVRLGFTTERRTGNRFGIAFGVKPGHPHSVIMERVMADEEGNPKYCEPGIAETSGLQVSIDNSDATREFAKRISVQWDLKSTMKIGETPYHFSLAFPCLETILKILVASEHQLALEIASNRWWSWKESRMRDDGGLHERIRSFLRERDAVRCLTSLQNWEVVIKFGCSLSDAAVYVPEYGRVGFEAILEHVRCPSEVVAEVRARLLSGREYHAERWRTELQKIGDVLGAALTFRVV